jgi:hypothetical protein
VRNTDKTPGTAQGTWRQVKQPKPNSKTCWPAACHSHTAVVWGEAMLVFGGVVEGAPSNQFLQFHFGECLTCPPLSPSKQATNLLFRTKQVESSQEQG